MLTRYMLFELQIRRIQRWLLSGLPLQFRVVGDPLLRLPRGDRLKVQHYDLFNTVAIYKPRGSKVLAVHRFDSVLRWFECGLRGDLNGFVPVPGDMFRFPDTIDSQLANMLSTLQETGSMEFAVIGTPWPAIKGYIEGALVRAEKSNEDSWFHLISNDRRIGQCPASELVRLVDDAISGWPHGLLPKGWSRPKQAYERSLNDLAKFLENTTQKLSGRKGRK